MASTTVKELESRLRGLQVAYKAIAALAAIKGLIGSGALNGGGKLKPARGLPGGSGIGSKAKHEEPKKVAKAEDGEDVIKIFADILKKTDELQEVTGVVLTPEVTDAQGDIISAAVIEKAAGEFLAGFNKSTKLGFMHKSFNKKFELRQSFIAPSDMVIGTKVIKQGAWVIVVKVLDKAIWQQIKDGKITGFSIGGKAKVQDLAA